MIAEANVGADGSFFGNLHGFSGCIWLGTGSYRLTLNDAPIDPNNITAQLSLVGAAGGQISYSAGASTIDVFTFDANGIAADKSFSIAVNDLT